MVAPRERCIRGHDLTDERNRLPRSDQPGNFRCRACAAEYITRWKRDRRHKTTHAGERIKQALREARAEPHPSEADIAAARRIADVRYLRRIDYASEDAGIFTEMIDQRDPDMVALDLFAAAERWIEDALHLRTVDEAIVAIHAAQRAKRLAAALLLVSRH